MECVAPGIHQTAFFEHFNAQVRTAAAKNWTTRWTRREHLLPTAMEYWNKSNTNTMDREDIAHVETFWEHVDPRTLAQNSVTSSSSEQRGQSIHLYYVITWPNIANNLQKHGLDPYVIWLQMWDLIQYINDLWDLKWGQTGMCNTDRRTRCTKEWEASSC